VTEPMKLEQVIKDPRPMTMYCGAIPDFMGRISLVHFYRSPRGVEMCMDERCPFPIFEVVVSEGTDPNGYWGWWDAESKGFAYVYPSKMQVEMCFPYGAEIEEKRNCGRMMPVNVRVIREVKP
jgi:hypothetical protein